MLSMAFFKWVYSIFPLKDTEGRAVSYSYSIPYI